MINCSEEIVHIFFKNAVVSESRGIVFVAVEKHVDSELNVFVDLLFLFADVLVGVSA